MTSTNPFEKLNVKAEEDENDPEAFKEVKQKQKPAQKPKHPVSKPENPKEEEEPHEQEEEEQNDDPEHKKRKGINFQREENRDYKATKNPEPKRGREFERHSGTGRGKEIAKGGAGGKGTWGENPKNIARDYEKGNVFEVEEEKRKKGKKRELTEEEKLKKPEGAISVEEYLKNNPQAKEEDVKEGTKKDQGEPLKKIEKNENDDIIGTSEEKKKKKSD